jgi:ribosomal-protein-serine acetyltransferase
VTAAVRGITGFAFEHLGARRVEIRCDSLNERRVRVAVRAGYRQDGVLRNAEVGADGSPRTLLVFSLLPTDRATGGRTPG